MKNAFAVSCWKPNIFHLQQAVACAASIREVGYDDDIVIMTIEDQAVPKLERACRDYNVQIRKCEPLVFYAHEHWQRNRSAACLLDGNKLQYWTLTEYHSVVGIDCDCIVHTRSEMLWNRSQFIAFSGPPRPDGNIGPVCSAAMTVNPNMDMFHEMRELIAISTFHPETGWNNCGPIKGVEGWNLPHWRFQSADSLQGFLVYYFHCLKGIFQANLGRYLGLIVSHAGNMKMSDWYLEKLRHLLGGKMTI